MTKSPIKLEVDLTQFQRVAEQLFKTDERSFPQFINGQLYAVARAAIVHTRKADRRQIAYLMGATSTNHKLRGGAQGGQGWVRSRREKIGFAKKGAA